MLKGQDLVYFAPEKWDGIWRNRHQLMSIFARRNQVLFVEPRPHLRAVLSMLRRGRSGLSALRQPSLRQISENLFVLRYPVWAPVSGRAPLKQLTRTSRRWLLQRALNRLHMSQPIVWFSSPGMADLVNEMPPVRLILYHVVDEYSAYTGRTPADRRTTEEREKEILALADMVIVVSRNLYEAKRPYNPNTYLVPNGVDYQAYVHALADPSLPPELQAIRSPRLGYIGLIGDKLDFRMLYELAAGNPEWSLVLLGEVRVAVQAELWQSLVELPNVHCLGAVHGSQVPHYVKGFQVGLMPYIQDRHAEYISPLKLYDYLAAGIPVVTVDIPAVQEFTHYVHIANGPKGFADCVRTALTEMSPEQCLTRQAVAAQHTWDARVEQLSDLIEFRLAKTINGVNQEV